MIALKIDPGQFENDLKAKLWDTIESHFLNEVYLAAEGSVSIIFSFSKEKNEQEDVHKIVCMFVDLLKNREK